MAVAKTREAAETKQELDSNRQLLAEVEKNRDGLTDEVNDLMGLISEVNSEIKLLKEGGAGTNVLLREANIHSASGIAGTAGVGEALLREDLEEALNNVKTVTEDLANERTASADEKKRMQAMLDEKQLENDDLMEEVADLTSESEELVQMTTEMNTEADLLREKLAAALSQTGGAGAGAQRSGPLGGAEPLISAASLAESEASSNSEELDDKKREIRVLEAKLQDQSIDNQDLQLQLQKSKREHSNAQFKITKLENEIESLKKKLAICTETLEVARGTPRRSSIGGVSQNSSPVPKMPDLGAGDAGRRSSISAFPDVPGAEGRVGDGDGDGAAPKVPGGDVPIDPNAFFNQIKAQKRHSAKALDGDRDQARLERAAARRATLATSESEEV